MKRWLFGLAVWASCTTWPAHLHAQADAKPLDAASALVAVPSADPLELARVVDRVGDRAVLALFAEGVRVEVRLAALRASPWLRHPQAALAPASALIAGRDPELAEAAARALEQIAAHLTIDRAQRSETDPAALTQAGDALAAVFARDDVRQDLRLSALVVSHELSVVAAALQPDES